MANWKEVTERWLPIVEKMEEHSMDDYAIPEIYRAAEKAITQLEEMVQAAVDYFEDGITDKEQWAAYFRFEDAVQPFLTKETNDED